MKNNKALIIVAVILLNVLVVFMIGQSLMGKTSKYDAMVNEARALAGQELCGRAIEKYNEALMIKDTIDIRLEMIKVYEKGMDIGEFTKTYEIFTGLTSMVEAYSDNIAAYEAACDLFLKHNKYEDCANILMMAQDLNVTSGKIEEYRKKVRYQYTKFFSMYTDVLPSFDGMITVKSEDSYTFLNDEGTADFDGEYTYATSFSENYAFVKSIYADGTEKSFIINKDGQRQAYLGGIETSSGVGKAKDENGNSVYLLACKKGDTYSYYDINGKKVFGEYEFAGRFRNNVAAIQESEGKWKLIDGTGKPISNTVFSDVALNEFDECAARGFIIAKTGDKYRIYDLELNQISGFACDEAKPFVDDYAAFKKGDLWGFVGTDGKVIIEPKYEDAKSFSNGIGAVKSSGGWNYINAENEIVIQETFEDVSYLNDNGICFVKSDGYWSYLKMYYTGK